MVLEHAVRSLLRHEKIPTAQVRRFANVQSSSRIHSTRTSVRNTRKEGEIQSKVSETFYLEGQNFDFKMIIRTRGRSSIYKRPGR